MELTIYQVDAFAKDVFEGNPAAVCPLQNWLPDAVMQNIAMENNLSETAFYVKEKDGYRIRWFTPSIEVDLCGHATLASAYVLFNQEGYTGSSVVFQSRSGLLSVAKVQNQLTLDFPVDTLTQVDSVVPLEEGLGVPSKATYKGKTDYLIEVENETIVRQLRPDLKKISQVKARGIIVTAKGESVDFVSRFFGPQSGVDEDPVTGSAHTTLTPYWSHILQKTKLSARQLSKRGGSLTCELKGNRVEITGEARLYLKGTLFID